MQVKIIACGLLSVIAFASVTAQDCGVANVNMDDPNSKLPWVVQVRERASGDVVCLGSLISDRHILVAAHCLWPKPYYKALKLISNIFVTIGQDNFDLMDVRINSGWTFNKPKFDGDMAIITLFYPVTLSGSVQPVCLPPFAGDIIPPNGIVAGTHGADNENIKQQINAEKNSDCFKNFPISFRKPSNRTFCAVWQGSELELLKDFSGAFYFKKDNKWFIQGIESESFATKDQCDIKKHSVFTNVGFYLDWVNKVVERDTKKQWKDVELKCTYLKNYEGLYGCEVENLIINSASVRIASVSGNHVDRNTNNEVEYVWIKDSKVTHLPRFDAGIFFPNMKKYLVTGSLLKFVERDDFMGKPKLETLDLSNNEIEELPEDVLFDLNELVDLFLDNNQIRSLSPNLLSHAPLFQRFRASNNSLEVIETDFFKYNPSLKILSLDNNRLHKIRADFRGYNNLKKIDLLNNPCINTNYNDWRKYKSVPIVQKEIESSCR